MKKFITTILLVFSISVFSLPMRMYFAKQKLPSLCIKGGGTWDKTVSGGACLFQSSVSTTLCASKGFKNVVQYHIPFNQSPYYGGCDTGVQLWPCTINDQISTSYQVTCDYQSCYSWGCNCGNACYSCVQYTLTSTADKVWCR